MNKITTCKECVYNCYKCISQSIKETNDKVEINIAMNACPIYIEVVIDYLNLKEKQNENRK